MDNVVHFEIPADDMARAQKFYSETFGWNANEVPGMGYTIVHTGPTDEQTMMAQKPGFVNGGMMQRTPEVSNPVITVGVADIDAAMAKVKEHGGSVVKEKAEIPGMGYASYVKDTEGNVIGLWQGVQG